MFYLLFFIAVVCSMLSQVPAFLESGLDAVLKYTWILPLGYLVFLSLHSVVNKRLYPFYLFLAAFFIYCLLCESAFGIKYVGVDLYNIAISCMVTAVSFAFWSKYGKDKDMSRLSIVILFCATLLSFVVYIDFISQQSIADRTYAYESKNSLGQILLSGVLIAIVNIRKGSKIKLMYIVISVLIIVVVFMLKSRATILGALFLLFYYAFKYNNKKVRRLILMLTILAIVFLLFNDKAYNIVVNDIMFASRRGDGLDTISSNRLSYIAQILPLFSDHIFFGIGEKYLDCFPIIIVIQYGILGAAIVFAFLFNVFRFTTFKIKHTNPIHLTTFLLFAIFMINSLFEAQPPFGPGVKCFLLWMMFGFSLAEQRKQVKTLKPMMK